MTRYKILHLPIQACDDVYRGVHRTPPLYDSRLPEDAGPNQAWSEYASMGEEVIERERAIALYDAMNGKAKGLDLLAVTVAPDKGCVADALMGFDVAAEGGFSLLCGWFDMQLVGSEPQIELARLIQSCFGSLRNSYGLFHDFRDAIRFRDVTAALQRLVPNMWESEYSPEAYELRLVAGNPQRRD